MKYKFFIFILIGLLILPMISSFSFDNIKGNLIKNKDTSEYGIVEIRNSMFGWEWFKLDKIMSLELKENTELCLAEGCSAKQEIIMYEDGKLIDDVRFIDLETNTETNIKDYEIYVNGDLYNGEEVSGYSDGVKYDVELKGKLYPFQKVDWQIKSAGTDWINDWAVWTSALTNGSIAYWSFDETSGTHVPDVFEYYDLTTNSTNWTTGLINNGLAFNSTGQTAYNDTFLDDNNTDLSFSFWFKLDKSHNTTGPLMDLWRKINKADADQVVTILDNAGKMYVPFRLEGDSHSLLSNQTNWEAGRWYNIILVLDGRSNVTLYVDGQLNHSTITTKTLNSSDLAYDFSIGGNYSYTDFNGTFDEFGVWNRTLTDGEITDLYNAGTGISAINKPSVTLNAPIDNYNTTNKSVTFNCSAVIREINISNISLYHNESGTWTLNQTNSTQRNLNSTAIFSINFQDYESIEWNCYACGNNSICSYGTNKTLTLKRLVINSETYNTDTVEGSLENFIINITTSPGLYISTATLTYNNTGYPGTLTQYGNEYLISKSINIDSVDASKNLTFNWTFLMSDSSTIYSGDHNQSVLVLTTDDCSVNTINILNYTLRDEDNQSKLNGSMYNTQIELDVSIYTKGTTNEIINFSNTYSKINPAEVCLNVDLGNTEYKLDVSTIYSSNNRETEHHYIQNYSLTNTTTHQNISLYDLNSSRSTTFLITYKDTNFLPIENALINIQREYVGDGLFRSVEIGKTDADGQTIGHFVKDDIVYTLIVSKDGQTLATFSNIVAWCEDIITENCKINLNQFDTGVPMEDWETYQNLDYTLSFDKDTRIVTLVFNVLDGSSAVITLNTTKSDRWMNETVCSDIVTSSSGTLTCTIADSYGNVSVISKVYMNEELITQANFKIFPDRDDYFGGTSVILLLILVIILPLMFITSTAGVVLGSIFGIIIAGALMIYTDFSWMGVRSSIIWIIIAGIILVWKIQERSKT